MTSPGRTARRQCTAYCWPSTVLAYCHQPPLRTGTDRSLSWVRALISAKIWSWSLLSPAVAASV